MVQPGWLAHLAFIESAVQQVIELVAGDFCAVIRMPMATVGRPEISQMATRRLLPGVKAITPTAAASAYGDHP